MERLPIMNKKTCFTALAVLAFGLAGAVHAQSSSMSTGATGGASTDRGASKDKADQKDMGAGKKRDSQGGYSMKDKPTRGGTEKSLGSSEPAGVPGGPSGSKKSPEGSALGGSTGDKGFSNVRENKAGKGSRGTMGGSTDTKPGHAGESMGSGGTGKGKESDLDAGAPATGSSPGIAK